MNENKLSGEELELHLKNRFGEDFKEKLKPTDYELKDNYMALAWCIKNGEVIIEDYIDSVGRRRKKEHMTGVSVEDSLVYFGLKGRNSNV